MAFLRLFDVIEYNGPETDGVFAWKHPNKELRPGSHINVQQSQVAVFLKQGQVVSVFPAGGHKVDGNNPVFLTGLTKMVTGGASPWSSQIWFINLTDRMSVKWGTPSPIPIPLPGVGSKMAGALTLPVRARGNFTVTFDTEKIGPFIERLAGTKDVIAYEDIQSWFRDQTVAIIKSTLATVMVANNVDLGHIAMYLDGLSQGLLPKVSGTLAEYGIIVKNFVIEDISPDENSIAFKEYKSLASRVANAESRAEAQRAEAQGDADALRTRTDARQYAAIASSQAKALDQQLRGYAYQQQRMFDVMDTAAANTGSGADLMNQTMGMGVGMAMGNQIGGMMADAMGNATAFNVMTPQVPGMAGPAAVPGTPVAPGGTPASPGGTPSSRPAVPQPPLPDRPGAQATPQSAPQPTPQSPDTEQPAAQFDPVAAMTQLKRMLDAGLIPQDVYDAKRDEILKRM
ncbi:SPFH domain-containing protein [Bifidobacterium parmae]|uniref:Antifreeze protein type I n=1 Tax=Bifidobacterium parmae TaxID=361854 RepID=A0A2N5IW48_9BIFI|nr:SPFH domain-containing protein [Bifidobacterium parmae]PLS26185.1 antifreeze protein type I [Bifidobacterium parmae]